jgi:heme-degrading monooxygenase HmoA
MTVTELAILPLTHTLTKESPTLPSFLIQKLLTTKSVLETASGHHFHYFQQVEDPSIIYILGSWDSVTAHGSFLPSPENQKLLELFKDDIIMPGEGGTGIAMWHLNSDVFSLDHSTGLKSVFTSPTISLNRHFVPASKKAAFESKFSDVRGLLEDFTNPYKVVGGWRIEKESEEKEEWALFSGFESVDHHMAFAKTEEFEKYREIVGFVEGFEVRHLRVIEGL